MKLNTALVVFLLALTACRRDDPEMMDKTLRHTLNSAKIDVLKPVEPHDPKLVELGKNLVFDKILSGRKDISCATCHHPSLHTGDAISLSMGVGGKGTGPTRVLGKGRIFNARNAPDLFNKGMPEFKVINWNGSISSEKGKLEKTPAGKDLPPGLNGPLAAQHLFELASRQRMRGEVDDSVAVDKTPNELASIPDDDFKAIWKAYMARLIGDPPGEGGIPEYIELFKAAYPTVPVDKIGIQHAVNAIAAWETDRWTSTNSPFDRHVAGDNDALNKAQKRGALLFYGKARCYECHSGSLLTDMKYHNIAAPQIGPGVGAEAPLDIGRGGITSEPVDKFKFRTPPLRNVVLTGPWMHSGAYTNLEAAVRHHLNPKEALRNYDSSQLDPRFRNMVQNKEMIEAGALITIDGVMANPINLNDQEFSDLMDFLQSLTDPKALDQYSKIPGEVPSGLPIYD
ncbi:MAG: cytochrome-c peroxidase [Deltaproteobacteria bacterium]|nr:cytochrome-c peroxidase [Deltaproteobacteria bacterium]